jgi:hypothetical protein
MWDVGGYDWQIYSALPSGRGLAQLTFAETPAVDPLPSPDGRLILFVRSEERFRFPRSGELWVMRPDGRGARRLVARGGEPAWAPDSRRIAYVRDGAIRLIGADGRSDRLLARNARAPAWSPDGSSLALARGASRADIVVRRSGVERTIDSGWSTVERIAWSPDGRWIAVSGGGGRLEVMRPNGAGARVVSRRASMPRWSPDGRRLAFTQEGRLQVSSIATGARRALGSRHPVYGVKSFAWSPGGDEIVYALGYDAEPSGSIEAVSLTGRVRRVPIPHPVGIGDTVAWTTVPAGLRFRAPRPVASPAGDELRLRHRVDSFAADGDRVAYLICNSLGAWRPGESAIVPVRRQSVLCGYDNTQFLYSVAVAGDRVAWASLQGGNRKSGWLTVAPIAPDARQTAVSAPRSRTSGDPRGDARSGYLLGDGPLLVFSEWAFCDDVGQPCIGVPVTDRRVFAQSVRRVREASWPESCPLGVETPPNGLPVGRCQTLRTEPGPFVPLDASEGRVVASGENETVILDEEGRALLSIPVSAAAAQLAGGDLVVALPGELRKYDASTGVLLGSYAIEGGLQDAAGGLVAYVLNGAVHLLRLADGATATVSAGTAARFGDTGLFYVYEAPYPWRGRIRFVPFERLPLRWRGGRYFRIWVTQ